MCIFMLCVTFCCVFIFISFIMYQAAARFYFIFIFISFITFIFILFIVFYIIYYVSGRYAARMCIHLCVMLHCMSILYMHVQYSFVCVCVCV